MLPLLIDSKVRCIIHSWPNPISGFHGRNFLLKSSVRGLLACILLKTSWHTRYSWYNNIYFKSVLGSNRFDNFLRKGHSNLIQGTICFCFSGSCDEKLILDKNKLFSFSNKVLLGSEAPPCDESKNPTYGFPIPTPIYAFKIECSVSPIPADHVEEDRKI